MGFMPMELFNAQEWDNKNKCTSLEQCREQFPVAITVSFWRGLGFQSREWQLPNKTTGMTNNTSPNYTYLDCI